MEYDPSIHNRRSIRLRGYDYTKAGAYFITICCQDRKHRFGKVKNGEMILNEFGSIAYQEWLKLPDRFPKFELDVFQIMPNHMHGIIILNDPNPNSNPNPNPNPLRAGFTPALNPSNPSNAPIKTIIPTSSLNKMDKPNKSQRENNDDLDDHKERGRAAARAAPTFASTGGPSIGNIIGAYKSLVANECLKIFKSRNQIMGKIWQRNYYENIIRDERAYNNISAYIINNPKKWKEDTFFKNKRT